MIEHLSSNNYNQMEFAWVRFHTTKLETCLQVSEIGLKQKRDGNVQIIPFRPKDEKDFVTTQWYFAKQINQPAIWSRIIILYLGGKLYF